jgi:cell division protein FtsW (lipid II flippase)
LPFISYGGTNLVVALMAIGVLVNVGRHAELEGDDFHTNPIRDAVRNV